MSHRSASDLILYSYWGGAKLLYFTEAIWPMCTHYISDFGCWKLHKITVKNVQLVVMTLSAGSALYNSSHCQVKRGLCWKGTIYTGVTLYANSFKTTLVNHTIFQAYIDFMKVWISPLMHSDIGARWWCMHRYIPTLFSSYFNKMISVGEKKPTCGAGCGLDARRTVSNSQQQSCRI